MSPGETLVPVMQPRLAGYEDDLTLLIEGRRLEV